MTEENDIYRIGGQDWEIGEVAFYSKKGKDIETTFRGFLSDGFSREGLYYDEKKKDWTYLDSEIDPALLEATKTIPSGRKQSASHIKTTSPVIEKTPIRSDPDTIFRLEIHEEDDEMVQEVKGAVNSRKLTNAEITKYSEYTYNLLYGLKKRHSIKFSSFKKWAKILNLKPVIQLLPKDKT